MFCIFSDKAKKHGFRNVLILVLFLLIVPALFRPLHSPDEGRYGEASRDVLANNNWFVPHINGIPHLTKPPLYYDLVALSFSVFGVNGFALRLVSLISFLILLYFTMAWTKKREGKTGAFLTGLIGATMIQSAVTAEFGDLNMLMCLWITLGMLCFFNALENPGRKRTWLGAWIFLALAFLTKGPPAFIIPLGSIVLYRIITRRKFAISFSMWFW